MTLFLVLGNQLFDPQIYRQMGIDPDGTIFFMREDFELASYYRFHKHKIIFFFAAMRAYRDELRSLGYKVHYEEFQEKKDTSSRSRFEASLASFVHGHSFDSACTFEIEDKFFEKRVLHLFKGKNMPLKLLQSPMFLTSREAFQAYLKKSRRPFMKTFYEGQRKRLQILVEDNKPVGGAWSFDNENRLALPQGRKTPSLPEVKKSETVTAVSALVSREFQDHPGEVQDFWLPVDRAQARQWLKAFLIDRLAEFGPYEDALAPHSDFVFHSVLTPFLNTGLLTPQEVVQETLKFAKGGKIPLASLEGFLRQIIGWREFVRGIYQNFSDKQDSENFWQHQNKLSPLWYTGKTGIPPLDQTIGRVLKRGYAHHIERLMVVGSLMVLLEVHPQEGHKWFMEMFIDSSDWVMGPNVYGMALFSDGGIFATKPYICGSNYLRKMGGFKKGEWCDGIDGLYWQFIKKHEEFFLKNPRLAMMARSCQKISSERWSILNPAAQELRKKLVVSV